MPDLINSQRALRFTFPITGALFNKETQTPRRPPHGGPSLHHERSLSSNEPRALSPRTLRLTAGNVDDRTTRTPCTRTRINHITHIAASPVPVATSRRSSGGIGHAQTERESAGAKTPAMKGGSCAICLSPLVKRDVYTIQLCRVRQLFETLRFTANSSNNSNIPNIVLYMVVDI